MRTALGLRLGVFLAWNAGCVRYFDGFKLRDMGLMGFKEQAQEWCRVNRVPFRDELPERWVGLARQRARMPLSGQRAGNQSASEGNCERLFGES